MAEPEVHRTQAYMPVSDEALAEADSYKEAVRRLLAGEPLPPGPPAPTTPPAGHLALLAATAGPLRAVVVLHEPEWSLGRWECRGCDAEGYEHEPPAWPCRTAGLIADQLGMELADG